MGLFYRVSEGSSWVSIEFCRVSGSGGSSRVWFLLVRTGLV